MNRKSLGFNPRYILGQGLLAGFLALNVSVLGMVELFGDRQMITGILTLGQVILYAGTAVLAYFAGKKYIANRGMALLSGLLIGAVSSLPLVLLIIVARNFNLREYFVNISPSLINQLLFEQGPAAGSLVLVLSFTLIGLLLAGIAILQDRLRQSILVGIAATLIIGMLISVVILIPFVQLIGIRSRALPPVAAVLIFLIAAGLNALWMTRGERIKARYYSLPEKRQTRIRRVIIVFLIIDFLLLPALVGSYWSEIIDNIGIFILMGLGLNIVVGFAGLLDLGYVAFFAIGAYTMGLLTSTGELGIAGLSFWFAIPIAIGVSVLAGIILGIPVLRMRGDYLAIVTLAFGEIIRILALSDLLKPFIGGAQGVLKIPNPVINWPKIVVFGQAMGSPQWFFYIIVAGCLLAWYVSSRLSEARLGRQWMAMREDEDVAEAMGIRLVSTKLLAFALGAAFSGLSGAIFAPKLTSIFPHSFNLLISINVLSLIIVGGIGSLPGVIVGAIFLIGLPELLREFAEYRLLMYGALLVAMMLFRPEGLWPSTVRRRELHAEEEYFEATEPEIAQEPERVT